MNPRTPEGPLPDLDTLLRRVGEWLLVGYTVAMVLVTFVVPELRTDTGERLSTSSRRVASCSCLDDGTGRARRVGGEAENRGSERCGRDVRRSSPRACASRTT